MVIFKLEFVLSWGAYLRYRLNEEPTENTVLADITCDSDGKIDKFANSSPENLKAIKLHELHPAERYFVGIFLVGAYQVCV